MNKNIPQDFLVSSCFTIYSPEIMLNIVTIIVQTRFLLKSYSVMQKYILLTLFIVVIKLYIWGLKVRFHSGEANILETLCLLQSNSLNIINASHSFCRQNSSQNEICIWLKLNQGLVKGKTRKSSRNEVGSLSVTVCRLLNIEQRSVCTRVNIYHYLRFTKTSKVTGKMVDISLHSIKITMWGQ
jgi:hypothetical protein